MSTVMEQLAAYVLDLYATDETVPDGIVTDLWERAPGALAVIVRAWFPEGWDPRDRTDVADGAHWYVAVYCREALRGGQPRDFSVTTVDMQGVMRVIADWALEVRA